MSENNERLLLIVVSGAPGYKRQVSGEIHSPGQMPEAWIINEFIQQMEGQGIEPIFYFVDPLYYGHTITDNDLEKIDNYKKPNIKIISATLKEFVENNRELFNDNNKYPIAFVDYSGYIAGSNISEEINMDNLNPHIIYIPLGCCGPVFNPYELINSKYNGYDIINNKFNRAVYDYRQAGLMPELLMVKDRNSVLSLVSNIIARARVFNPTSGSVPAWAQQVPPDIAEISGTLDIFTPKQIYANLINFLNRFIRSNYPNIEPPYYNTSQVELSKLQNFILQEIRI